MPDAAKCPKCGAEPNAYYAHNTGLFLCGSKSLNDHYFQSDNCRIRERDHRIADLTSQLAALTAANEALQAAAQKLDEANTPFEDAEPHIKVSRHDLGWYEYHYEGGTVGPYKTWREAYRAAEGYRDYVEQKIRGDGLQVELTIAREQLAEANRWRERHLRDYEAAAARQQENWQKWKDAESALSAANRREAGLREAGERLMDEIKTAWDARILPADAISGEACRMIAAALAATGEQSVSEICDKGE